MLAASAGAQLGDLTAKAAGKPAVGVPRAAVHGKDRQFGMVFAGSTVTKSVVTVTNTGKDIVNLNPSLSGDAGFTIVLAPDSCGQTLGVGASCSVSVQDAPAAGAAAAKQIAKLDLGFAAGTRVNPAPSDGSDSTVRLVGEIVSAPTGAVKSTGNPQVAEYDVTLPAPGAVTVQFGTTTAYGLRTWTKATKIPGVVSILVAGMLGNTEYHMQATVTLPGGSTIADADHTFTTGASVLQPSFQATTTGGAMPQPGVEQLTLFAGQVTGLAVADLQGNMLWSYAPANMGGAFIQGATLLGNGDYLLDIGGDPAHDAVREIDLAGNTVREVTMAQLNANLATAGYPIVLNDLHHDILALKNGHWMVLAQTKKSFTDLPGYPGVTVVPGDVLIDVDPSGTPVWVWNEFDHLDINRHPFSFPDWTHTNAMLYSPTDGNLIVSVRHQNWVLKVDYRDGLGSGNILWHLGEGGDFQLVGGNDPQDWQYAQHRPSLYSPNSAGVFSLGMMDNGDDRQFAPGVVCGTVGNPLCLYTSIPVFQIDESAKTATLLSRDTLPPNEYSAWGGNAELLANGDTEFDLSALSASDTYEVTPGNTPQTVWHLHSPNSNIYRGYRLPSLYPGVQW